MATEYIVICDQEAIKAKTQTEPTFPGAAAEFKVESIRAAKYLLVSAESTAEAIRGVKSLYPGWIKTKCIAVEKSATEEA